MTTLRPEAKRWRFRLVPILSGVILLAGICMWTVWLLGHLAVYFVPMYVVIYLQHLERRNRLTLFAAAVLIVVLAFLSSL